jgi:hypothetical protein
MFDATGNPICLLNGVSSVVEGTGRSWTLSVPFRR